MLILGSTILANRYSYNDVLNDNSWATIKTICQMGSIPDTWNVGDTKEFVGKDGNTYHVRLVDKQAGRYQYSNSTSITHAVFEFVELPNITTRWNTSQTNVGGYAQSLIRKNLNGLTGVETGKNFLTDVIPDDLRPLLEDVDIVTTIGGRNPTTTSTTANKLFPACYINLTTASSPYSLEGTRWDYYTTHTTKADRQKALVGTTTYQRYFLATAFASVPEAAMTVESSGGISNILAQLAQYVAPCWAW